MLFMLLYVLDTALSFIFIHIIGNVVPSFFMVFVSVSLAIIFFNLINYKTIIQEYKTLFTNHLNLLILLNLFAFVTWIGSFIIPIYFSPSVCIMVMFFTTAICGNISSYMQNKKNKVYWLIIGIIILNFIYLLNLYAVDLKSGLTLFIFSLSSVLSGLFGYFYLKTSFKLGKVIKLSSTQVLAVRFWMLWFFSIGLIIYSQQYIGLHLHYYPKLLLVTVVTLIAPSYFLQKAIEKIGANYTGIFIGLVPFTIVIIEILILNQRPEFLVPAIAHGLIILGSNLYMRKKIVKL